MSNIIPQIVDFDWIVSIWNDYDWLIYFPPCVSCAEVVRGCAEVEPVQRYGGGARSSGQNECSDRWAHGIGQDAAGQNFSEAGECTAGHRRRDLPHTGNLCVPPSLLYALMLGVFVVPSTCWRRTDSYVDRRR